MTLPKLHSAYQPHARVQLTCTDHSLAKQSMKSECDIDFILKKHRETGILTHVNTAKPNFDDCMDAPSYHEALNQIKIAQDSFATLPSEIRIRFANNPADFIAFAQDPKNAEEMADLGLTNIREATIADEFANALEIDRKKHEKPPKTETKT